jgi:hypothetical protein
MSIKPVDFQVMLPKTSEVSRQSSDDQHRNLSLLQMQSQSTQNKSELNLRQVHSQDKTPEARIKEKQEKNQGGRKEEKKKNKKDNNSDNTSTIDIRL